MIQIPASLTRRSLPAFFVAAIAAALTFTCAHAFDGFNGPVDVFNQPDPNATPTPAPAPGNSGSVAFPNATGNTIVNANQRVQPNKRGICENHMSEEDFKAVSPGVSWFYNWASSTSDMPAPGDHMDFVPMAWGHPGDGGAAAGMLGSHPRAILAINEPNLRGQAFMTPEATAAMYKQIKMAADAAHITVVGPNMALGSGPNDSIKAKSPTTNKDTVYTWFGIFMDDFKYYLKKSNTETGPGGVHSYKDMNELRWAVSKMHEETGKPVWVTEFAFWDAPTPDVELKYMKDAVEYLENSPDVAGYAWFMNRVGKNPKISLLDKPGKLTPLGEEYVKLPSHSMHVFYRIPGLLDAGKYVTRDNMTLDDTSDSTGDFDMISSGPASVDYNIQVDKAGTYALKLRVSGVPGKIEIVQDNQILGTVNSTKTQWQTVETTVPLLAGAQTLRIRCNGQTLHSLDFAMLK